MAVIIGSARGDENGRASGGKAGDQTGREVSTQNWYKHTKGWRVLRAKNPEISRYATEAMRNACANNNIGYDQSQNQTLWNAGNSVDYDPSKIATPVETDCARLVRFCVQYACKKAGLDITIPDFYTATLASKLLGTGLFIELTGSKYTDQSAYLGAGDILVTRVKGHTVIVLTNGDKYEGSVSSVDVKTYKLGERVLKNGMCGDDVKELQEALNKLGYNCGIADGDFGAKTETSLKNFQKDHGCDVDGVYGPASHNAMIAALNAPAATGDFVTIIGSSVNIRKGPGTSYSVLKTAHNGDKFERVDATGWVCVKYNNVICWASAKYVNNGVCTANTLNVRKGPGTAYASVGTVKNGYKFDVVGTDGWVPILIDGVIYWVSAKYAA